MPYIYNGEDEVWMDDAEAAAFFQANPNMAWQIPDIQQQQVPQAPAAAPAQTAVDPMTVVRNAGLESLFAPQIIDENNNMSAGSTPTFNAQGFLERPQQRDPNYNSDSGLPEFLPATPYYQQGANGNAEALNQSGQWVDSGQKFNNVENGGFFSMDNPLWTFAGLIAAGGALNGGFGPGMEGLLGTGGVDSSALLAASGDAALVGNGGGLLAAGPESTGAIAGSEAFANTVGASGGDALGSLIASNAPAWGVEVAPEIAALGMGAGAGAAASSGFTGATEADVAMEMAPEVAGPALGAAPQAAMTAADVASTSNPMDSLMEWVKANPMQAASLGIGAAGLLGGVKEKLLPEEDAYTPPPINQDIVNRYGGVPSLGTLNYQQGQGTPNYQGFQSLSAPSGLLQMRLNKMRGLL